MNDTGVIDNFLNIFTGYIDSGFGLLGGEVAFLSTTLIAIDVTLAGLFWAWGADEDVLQRLVKKTLYIGTFAFIIGNFSLLATIVFESFAGLGLQASGGAMTIDEFMKPGTIAAKGLEAAKPLLDAAGQFSSLWAVFSNLALILVLLLAWVIVVLAFFIIAVQVFITLIEYKLVTLAGFVLLPFAFFNKTAFMAEKVLGHVVSTGIKVLVLAIITGIGTISGFLSRIGRDSYYRLWAGFHNHKEFSLGKLLSSFFSVILHSFSQRLFRVKFHRIYSGNIQNLSSCFLNQRYRNTFNHN